jgi:hypothetical protein
MRLLHRGLLGRRLLGRWLLGRRLLGRRLLGRRLGCTIVSLTVCVGAHRIEALRDQHHLDLQHFDPPSEHGDMVEQAEHPIVQVARGLCEAVEDGTSSLPQLSDFILQVMG